jgi:energy-coupling factor transporter ATP-binding protein EcfA2
MCLRAQTRDSRCQAYGSPAAVVGTQDQPFAAKRSPWSRRATSGRHGGLDQVFYPGRDSCCGAGCGAQGASSLMPVVALTGDGPAVCPFTLPGGWVSAIDLVSGSKGPLAAMATEVGLVELESAPMRRPELSDNGAHFYRTDFQVHTPRDTQWDGARPSSESERKEYAMNFVAECRNLALHAVAITDHHDFAYFPYIAAAAESEVDEVGRPWNRKDRLIVFPGIELTLSVPCQAILILDANFPQDRLPDVLKALHFDPIDPELDSIPQTKPLSDSGDITAVHEKLDKHSWLKGKYIILPNVTPGGHKTLLRTSFQAKYVDMPCIGGYIDGSMSVFDKYVGEKRILDGGDVHWGNKRVAIFQTSDARSLDFAKLGINSTWVKWTEPTAEALRQACLASESRIAQAELAAPNVWISSVVVSNSKFLGRVDVSINPQYTALIGGRGTGKSTILDYLRWALCDQPARASDDDEVADPRVRQRRLIAATLTPLAGHVEVHCMINGIAHVVRRHAENGEVHLKVGDAAFERVRESVVQSLLPVQAYSQKQLSSVAIREDELLRFVTSPIQRQLEDIDRKLDEVSGRLRENYGTLQRHRVLANEIGRSEVRLKSLVEQSQSLRDGLAGLSAEDRGVLDAQAPHEEVDAASTVWVEQFRIAQTALADLWSTLESAGRRIELPDIMPPDVQAEAETLAETVRSAIGSVKADVAAIRESLAARISDGGDAAAAVHALNAKLEAFDESYAAVKQRSTAHDIQLKELANLEIQQREGRELLQKQRQEFESLGAPLKRHGALRQERLAMAGSRSDALKIQCDKLSASSDGLIRATVASGTGFNAVQEKLKNLISGSNVRGAKVEGLFLQLSLESDPAATWELLLTELESLTLLEADVEIRSEQTPNLSRLGITISDQKKIVSRLTSDGWLDLSLTPLADHPEFHYRSKEDVYIPFNSASVGQQATALLTTLLSQEGMPLVIDQPEDDLDSDTVQQIVTKIWASKNRRQLIFSSHNANLVVNGDADLVLVCAYSAVGDQSAGHIKLEGAIDMQEVRSAITAVMEGGERAFRLRQEKYGF